MNTKPERQVKTIVPRLRTDPPELIFENSKWGSQATILKSALETKRQLDSVVEYWNYGSDNQLVIGGKHEFGYDGNGKRIEYSYCSWDSVDSQWVEIMVINYEYNRDGNLIKETTSERDEISNQMIYYSQTRYSYDDTGNQYSEFFYTWDTDLNSWRGMWRYEYEYDNGNLTLSYYNTSDKKIKTEYIYDTDKNLITEFNYYWNTVNSQWLLTAKVEYEYNREENIMECTTYGWIDSLGWIQNPRKWEYKYDVYGNEIVITMYEKMSFDDNQWYGSYKFEYEYNDYNNRSIETYFGAVNGVLEEGIRSIYFYSEYEIIDINEIVSQIINLYPNPVSEYLNFELPGTYTKAIFELFDLQGRKLITKEISNSERISLESLTNGMYLYTIDIDGYNQSGKLVKK